MSSTILDYFRNSQPTGRAGARGHCSPCRCYRSRWTYPAWPRDASPRDGCGWRSGGESLSLSFCFSLYFSHSLDIVYQKKAEKVKNYFHFFSLFFHAVSHWVPRVYVGGVGPRVKRKNLILPARYHKPPWDSGLMNSSTSSISTSTHTLPFLDRWGASGLAVQCQPGLTAKPLVGKHSDFIHLSNSIGSPLLMNKEVRFPFFNFLTNLYAFILKW